MCAITLVSVTFHCLWAVYFTKSMSETNKSIPVLNKFLHENQCIILSTSLKLSMESGNLQSYDEQSKDNTAYFQCK